MSDEEQKKTEIPHRMSRIAWPNAKYGLFLAIIMFGVLGFLPGWILAKILHGMGKLRIPRDVELAGLDYNIMEQAQKDERAVASSNR